MASLNDAAADGGKEGGDGSHTVYARRWYILSLYSLLACLQGWQWAIPGGIGTSLEAFYGGGVTDYVLQILLAYGPIFYLPFALPSMLALNAPDGLRIVTLSGLALVVAGAGCRLAATSSSPASLALLHLGYVLNAIAGPAAMGCVSTLAEAYFPAAQRGLATAIAAEANQLGSALAFPIGPAMVPDGSGAQNLRYNILFGALALATLLAAVAYYPSQPPRPPSRSAAAPHAGAAHELSLRGVGAALAALAANRDFMAVCLTYGFCNGMMSSWGNTFVLNLRSLSIEQATAGYISMGAILAGNVGGLVISGIADRVRNHRLLVLLALYVSGVMFAWFALVTQSALPAAAEAGGAALAQVAVAATVGGYFMSGVIPLFYELAVEATYPDVPEAYTIMAMTTVNNFGSLVLLFVPINGTTGPLFNWLLTGTVAVSAIAMSVFFRDRATRWKVDSAGGAEAAGAEAKLAAAGGDEARQALLLDVDEGAPQA
jgi:MFS family permease